MNKFWSQVLLQEALREQQRPPNWHSPNFTVTEEQTFGPRDAQQQGQHDPQQITVLSPHIWEEAFLNLPGSPAKYKC